MDAYRTVHSSKSCHVQFLTNYVQKKGNGLDDSTVLQYIFKTYALRDLWAKAYSDGVNRIFGH